MKREIFLSLIFLGFSCGKPIPQEKFRDASWNSLCVQVSSLCEKFEEKKGTLTYLDLSDLNLKEIPRIDDFTHLEILNISDNPFQNFENFKHSHVKSLIAHSIGLNHLQNLLHFSSLEHLDLSSNQIYQVNHLSFLRNLKSLSIDSDYISLEDLSSLKELPFFESLKYKNKNLKEIDLDKFEFMKNLKNLNISGNFNLKKFKNIEKMKKLEILDIRDTSLGEIYEGYCEPLGEILLRNKTFPHIKLLLYSSPHGNLCE